MKRIWTVMLTALLLCMTAACALAYDHTAYGAENTPPEIREFLEESRWAGWEVTGWVSPGSFDRSAAGAFAAVKSGKKNVLLAFKWNSNAAQYAYAWYNDAALPQSEEPVGLGMYGDAGGQPRFQAYAEREDGSRLQCFWQQEYDGAWKLCEVSVYAPPSLQFIDTRKDGMIAYTDAGWDEYGKRDGRVYGEYQRDLRYFSFAAFPLTLEAARKKLTNPPEIPDGTLSAKRVKFSSGKKYKVYAGPGEIYGQAGGGKAIVSTNDWIQVFGVENGYAMIQYDISNKKMRIGWIEEAALPENADVPMLDYAAAYACITHDAEATDDPLGSRAAVFHLTQGQEVLWLASMGDWAYIHAWTQEGKPLRGFVPADMLEMMLN